jgi:hypothetical protein
MSPARGPAASAVGSRDPGEALGEDLPGCYATRPLRSITPMERRLASHPRNDARRRVERLAERRGRNPSAACAVSAIPRVIGAASALSARRRGYGKEKVYVRFRNATPGR